MATSDLGKFSADERLIYWLIVSTWAAYLTGLLYVIAPILGWGLAARIIAAQALGRDEIITTRTVAFAISLLWLVAIAVMSFVMVIGHLNFGLGALGMVKSGIGILKGWALFGVFVFIGMHVRVRPDVIFRATGVLGLQTLILAPALYAAPSLGVPQTLYTSPLDALLGGGYADFVRVTLYFREGIEGGVRWKFFAPWAPGAALAACLSLAMVAYDKSIVWRLIGIAANIAVCTMAQSRLAYLTMPLLLVAYILAPRMRDPRLLFAFAIAGMILIINADAILTAVDDVRTAFNSARSQSSRVRTALQSIALHRWWDEAPLFGHGNVEGGSHLTEWMAIGTHHSWNGLLFTRGIVGLLCLAVPMLVMLIIVLVKAATDVPARAALLSMVALLMYSFGDNLDVLFYLYWPTFMLFGIVIAPASPRTSPHVQPRSEAPRMLPAGAAPAT